MLVQSHMWDRLCCATPDVIVIGGGINGAGITREASRRGLSTLLIEQHDIASGTSSRSSKLVHGGLRYLELAEFSLVFESVSERRTLLNIAPHLVQPLGFLFPVYESSRVSLGTVQVGMWLYEALAKFDSPNAPKKLNRSQVERIQPALTTEHLDGATLYFDAATDDARLTLENAIDAAEHGAILSTWTTCDSFIKKNGRIIGVTVTNRLTGETASVMAPCVVNATGPWTESILSLDTPTPPSVLRTTKGVHLTLPANRLPIQYAVLCLHPKDQRVLFIIPWGDLTYVGTTDTDHDGDPDDVHATQEDIHYLIEATQAYFPQCHITSEDVQTTWAALRPLMRPNITDGTSVDESSVSREHQIIRSKSGLITLAGGKLTTYRTMAIETVDTVIKILAEQGELPCLTPANTELHPLPGSRNWPYKNLPDDELDRYNAAFTRVAKEVTLVAGGLLDDWTTTLLVRTYGTRAIEIARFVYADPSLARHPIPGRPEILAQVVYAISHELCATLSDFMMTRTQIFFRARDRGWSGVQVIADTMQNLLQWSDSTKQSMINDYRAIVAAELPTVSFT